MNAMSLEALVANSYRAPMFDVRCCGISGCGDATYSDLGPRLRVLMPRARQQLAERAIEWGVQAGIDECLRRSEMGMGMAALSEDAITSAVSVAVQRALTPLMPTLSAELMKVAEPAAKKAADVVGPVIEEKLRDYGPTLALITGIAAAVLSVIGMLLVGAYVVKKVG